MKIFNLEIHKTKLRTDINEIYEVEKSAFPPNRWASKKTLQNRIQLFPEGSLVAKKDNHIIAFTTVLIVEDLKSLKALDKQDKELHKAQNPIYWLRSLVVHKEHQRKGIGEKLIKKSIDHAKSLGKTHYRFTASKEVEPFYTKLNFKKLGNYEDFHGLPQIIWEMKLI
jgi:predicted N-acetyltransferase YhbS